MSKHAQAFDSKKLFVSINFSNTVATSGRDLPLGEDLGYPEDSMIMNCFINASTIHLTSRMDE